MTEPFISVSAESVEEKYRLFVKSMVYQKMFCYETVPELLQKSAKQILRTMDCHLSNLHADEMFFQYQGDILNINEIGAAPVERQKLQLDALPFHLQVMSDKKGYFYIEAGKINKEAGYELIPGISPETKVKPYVLDNSCLKKPFGGWGDLYIMDYPTKDFVDQMENPYGEGTLYQTGHVARITPSGEVEFLESTGRTVMIENLKGRNFVDLHQVEEVLCEYEGVSTAQAYTYYGADNTIHVGADVTGVTEIDVEAVKAYMADKLNPAWVPKKIVCIV